MTIGKLPINLLYFLSSLCFYFIYLLVFIMVSDRLHSNESVILHNQLRYFLPYVLSFYQSDYSHTSPLIVLALIYLLPMIIILSPFLDYCPFVSLCTLLMIVIHVPLLILLIIVIPNWSCAIARSLNDYVPTQLSLFLQKIKRKEKLIIPSSWVPSITIQDELHVAC